MLSPGGGGGRLFRLNRNNREDFFLFLKGGGGGGGLTKSLYWMFLGMFLARKKYISHLPKGTKQPTAIFNGNVYILKID